MQHVGEVVISSTTGFTAQCPDEDCVPPLGSFVVVEAPPGRALAVVSEIRAASFDANRRPVAYGLSDEDLYREQPQLKALLSTEFDALLVGYDGGDGWRQLLPPRPPRLHRFVHPATPEDVQQVTANGDYLRTLTAAEATDDLLAAAVRGSAASLAPQDRHHFLIATGRALARLLADDYNRLQALLRRVSQ